MSGQRLLPVDPKKTNIPTNEEFCRVVKLLEEEERIVSTVRDIVFQHFKSLCPLHHLQIFGEKKSNFEVCIFFEKEKDVDTCKKKGIVQSIIDCVYYELEHAGLGRKDELNVLFEFDSHENVCKKFNGSYYKRFR